MPDGVTDAILVTCLDCPFEREVGPEDDRLPADVLVEHGKSHNHKLTIRPVED